MSRGHSIERANHVVRALCVGALAVGLAACASPPPRPDSLDAAGSAVAAARNDMEIQRHASRELDAAENALQRAETAWQEGEPIVEIEHLVYLTNRRIAIAEAVTEMGQAEAMIDSLIRERDQVRLQAREAELQRAEQRAAAAEMAARKKEMELQRLQEELEAERTERGLVVSLRNILFDVDEAELKPGGEQQLSRVAEFLIDNANRNIVIEGHTDNTGPDAYNLDLSQRRANAVELYLISQGIDRNRMDAEGYGEQFPVATNATTAGRQQNRRVEIVILDPGEPLPPRRTE